VGGEGLLRECAHFRLHEKAKEGYMLLSIKYELFKVAAIPRAAVHVCLRTDHGTDGVGLRLRSRSNGRNQPTESCLVWLKWKSVTQI
jgi:hypothetical protein